MYLMYHMISPHSFSDYVYICFSCDESRDVFTVYLPIYQCTYKQSLLPILVGPRKVIKKIKALILFFGLCFSFATLKHVLIANPDYN